MEVIDHILLISYTLLKQILLVPPIFLYTNVYRLLFVNPRIAAYRQHLSVGQILGTRKNKKREPNLNNASVTWILQIIKSLELNNCSCQILFFFFHDNNINSNLIFERKIVPESKKKYLLWWRVNRKILRFIKKDIFKECIQTLKQIGTTIIVIYFHWYNVQYSDTCCCVQ